jgi:hypothetical protein
VKRGETADELAAHDSGRLLTAGLLAGLGPGRAVRLQRRVPHPAGLGDTLAQDVELRRDRLNRTAGDARVPRVGGLPRRLVLQYVDPGEERLDQTTHLGDVLLGPFQRLVQSHGGPLRLRGQGRVVEVAGLGQLALLPAGVGHTADRCHGAPSDRPSGRLPAID